MVASLVWVRVGVVGAGEALVSTGLPVRVAGLAWLG